MTKLSCGGKGPCCHVGYPHRHCEHCDQVIATYACHHPYYWPYQTYYGTTFQPPQIGNNLANQLQALGDGTHRQ